MKTLKNVLIITDSATVTADIVCNSIKQVIYIIVYRNVLPGSYKD